VSFRNRFILLTVLITSVATYAASDPRDRLTQLRGELDSLSTVLSRYTRSERDLGKRIQAADQQISTRQQLIRELETQRTKEQRAIVHYDTRIGDTNERLGRIREQVKSSSQEVEELEKLVADRAVYIYKHGSRRSLHFMAAAENPGDLIRRRVYVERIQQRDSHNLQLLREARQRKISSRQDLEQTLEDLQTSRRRKQRALERVDKLVSEGRSERGKLERDKRELQTLLVDAQKNRKTLEGLIADREQALHEVENWITSLESRRLSNNVQEITVGPRPGEVVVHEVTAYSEFSKAKGKLPWPLEGRVINPYGMQKNKVTGTLTENPGIDIRAKAGDEVVSVQAGVCKRITFLRGFGTTILVEHGDGYYTVYAHMGEVWISEGEAVEAGRVLGTVAEQNSTGDTSLHFQVWHKRAKQNPMEWLAG